MLLLAVLSALIFLTLANADRLARMALVLFVPKECEPLPPPEYPRDTFIRGADYRVIELHPSAREYEARFEGLYEHQEGCSRDVAFVFERSGSLVGLKGNDYRTKWVCRLAKKNVAFRDAAGDTLTSEFLHG